MEKCEPRGLGAKKSQHRAKRSSPFPKGEKVSSLKAMTNPRGNSGRKGKKKSEFQFGVHSRKGKKKKLGSGTNEGGMGKVVIQGGFGTRTTFERGTER